MDKPPILDELMNTIAYIESLIKEKQPRIDPRWFQLYEPGSKPQLKVVKDGPRLTMFNSNPFLGGDDGEEK